MTEFPEIEGEGISLIHLNPSHLNDMFEYSRLETFYEHLEFSRHRSLQDTELYLQRLISRSNGADAKWWFIRLHETQKVILNVFLPETLDTTWIIKKVQEIFDTKWNSSN